MPKKNVKKELALVNTLDERKEKILFTIIKLYLETGEPVGSRTISKKIDIDLSSATIRNEMSDLEDLGYIIKPHTSAGRIPSDKGYRLYVNTLIKEKETEIHTIKAEMTKRVDKLEDMMKTLVKTISSSTNYAAMISGPSINDTKIKYAQLSNLEENKVLVVLVAEGNVVKTSIVDLGHKLNAKEILDLSEELNNILSGLMVSELSKIKKVDKNIQIIVDATLAAFAETGASDNIFTYGANNFFKYKDFDDIDNVGNLVEAFEQKKDLMKLVDNSSENALKVYIGDETPVSSMKNCSVITANCDFGNGIKGTIGVVGPKRMDYEKVLKTIKLTMQNIDRELNDD